MIDTNGVLESLLLDAEMAAGMADVLNTAHESYYAGDNKFNAALWALVAMTDKVAKEARAISNVLHKKDIEEMRSKL